MNEQEIKALQALKASKNYQDVCEETVERIFMEQLPKYKKLKDAEKAAAEAAYQAKLAEERGEVREDPAVDADRPFSRGRAYRADRYNGDNDE